MTKDQIIKELRSIQAMIESDRFTFENISRLVAKLNN